MKQLLFFILCVIFQTTSFGQTWQWTGRTHGELEWSTIETAHYRIHYHQGIESIAQEGASIAEQVRQVLLQQMALDDIPTIDIIFTTEDEIMNGFALWTYTTFIWVDQNDAAIWLETDKWLKIVIAHELQHIVFFHKIKTWLPEPWSFLFSKTPMWVVEGLAEYKTERWRTYRAEISHKFHVLKNSMDKMDPHHDGYSKLLYWSDRFGDSTIVNTLTERNSFGLINFKTAFKKNTGITVDQFNEDWRRHMNTYYYGYRAQKEAIEEIGKTVTLPIKRLHGFAFYSDSTQIAISGLDDRKQRDLSLYVLQRDTTKEAEIRIKRKEKREKETQEAEDDRETDEEPGFFARLFGREKDDDKAEQKPKPIVIWDKEEVDFGSFHKNMDWSPDGRQLAYAKYHFGENQSLVYDLKVYDLDLKSAHWLTQSERATYPDWSPDGQQIVYVAHENSIANLFTMNADGSGQKQITDYTYDTQILNPRYAPDGKAIAFAMADKNANLDLFLFTLADGEIRRLTTDPAADYDPVWHPGSDFITYTSHTGSTPNLHTINLATANSKQISDVGDALWAAQWSPKDSTVMAITLQDVDTVRIVNVDPHRTVTTPPLALRSHYTDWRSAEPAIPLVNIDPQKPVDVVSIGDYKMFSKIKHVTSLILPNVSGVFGLTQWTDAMSRHLFTGLGYLNIAENGTNYLFLQYTNAMGGHIWGINYIANFDLRFKPYDKANWGLLERNSSLSYWAHLPYNFGNTMSNNHRLNWSVTFTDRNAKIVKGFDKSEEDFIYLDNTEFLPLPVSGKEALFSLSYTWLNRRNHSNNNMNPRQGQGINVIIGHANSGLYGDFDYTRIITDAFLNYRFHKKSPVVIFGRVKSLIMLGNNPPLQDMPAITNDFPIYFHGNNILGSNEVIHLRGWDNWRLGDRLVFGTIEPRLGSGNLVIATFIDFGNAWFSDNDMDDWLITAGAELRVNLLGFVVAYGTAQEIERWQNNEAPTNYLRLSLVNPF